MIFILTARHFKAHDTLKQFAEEEAQKLTKYYEGITRVEVILSYDKPVGSIKTAEVIVHAKPNHNFMSKDSTDDFKLSIETAFGKISTQIKKYKDKLTDHHIAAKAVNNLENNVNNHTDVLHTDILHTDIQHTDIQRTENTEHKSNRNTAGK